MSLETCAGQSEGYDGLAVVVPDVPPALTPAACVALLKLLRAHNLVEVAAEVAPLWDKPG